MEHIEQAGVHSGDSACSLPPFSLSREMQDELRRQTVLLAKGLQVIGLMNIQFAIKGSDVYVLEVNPRASRTVPYVSKATGRPLAKISARVMAGEMLGGMGVNEEIIPNYFSVKEAVFPFIKFPGVDTILGPEMRSTGEVMGVGPTFPEAFVKSQLAAGVNLPSSGKAFLSVRNSDKSGAVVLAKALVQVGFQLVATKGTAKAISEAGLPVTAVNKVTEGRPHIVDMIKNGEIAMIINTVDDSPSSIKDSYSIRRTALQGKVTYFTTIAGAKAASAGIALLQKMTVCSVQELHKTIQ